MSQRVCFHLLVKPDCLHEHRTHHARVSRGIIEAIAGSSRRNYSLFLHDEGMLTDYYEAASVEASQAALSTDTRSAPWEAAMADFFVSLDGRPDQGFVRLPEIFNLHDQLAKDAS